MSATTILVNDRANAKYANDVDLSQTAAWFAMVVDDVRPLTTPTQESMLRSCDITTSPNCCRLVRR